MYEVEYEIKLTESHITSHFKVERADLFHNLINLSTSYTIQCSVYALARILINQKAQRYESKNFSLPWNIHWRGIIIIINYPSSYKLKKTLFIATIFFVQSLVYLR